MSLYQLSKFFWRLNRDDAVQTQFLQDPAGTLKGFDLTDDERTAVLTDDIGLIYVLGVNGQLLMHFAALRNIEWSDYLQLMRDGVQRHGPVRAGVYAMTTDIDERVAGA